MRTLAKCVALLQIATHSPTFRLREIRTYASPRFWVDLLQQHTGNLRWTPVSRARFEFIRYDDDQN